MSRGADVDELMRFPFAFLLLTQIARRAVRTSQKFNPHNLYPGQALIGDHHSIGASLQNYRTAKARLDEWGFATFKPTNRGTIATLLDTRVYDINVDSSNNPTNKQNHTSSTNEAPPPATTNKEGKKLKNAEPWDGLTANERSKLLRNFCNIPKKRKEIGAADTTGAKAL